VADLPQAGRFQVRTGCKRQDSQRLHNEKRRRHRFTGIRWIPAKATCLSSSVLVVTFCVPSVKGEHEFVSGFRAGLEFGFASGNADGELGGMSAVCQQFPLLSWANFKSIDDRQILRFLRISRISRKWISCCQLEGIRIINWRSSYPPIALPAHIYIILHIVLILCDCKRLTALHSSPRVSYEHARSPIQTAQAVFGCNCLFNDRPDENISSIHSILNHLCL
jgi:hypothetical protein